MTYVRQMILLSVTTLMGFALYVVLFWIGAGSAITILFYRGVLLALAAAVVVGISSAWFARRAGDESLPIAAAAVSLAFNICFLVLLPVTVDRSISVYLLATIDGRQQGGITRKELEHAFVDRYVVKMGAIDRRIDEQRKSGNVRVTPDGKVHLTDQGKGFMSLSRIVARLFGTDPRFVSGAAASAPAPSRS
jgi:hypothetical protein